MHRYHVICVSGICTKSLPSSANLTSGTCHIGLSWISASGTCRNGKSGYSLANHQHAKNACYSLFKFTYRENSYIYCFNRLDDCFWLPACCLLFELSHFCTSWLSFYWKLKTVKTGEDPECYCSSRNSSYKATGPKCQYFVLSSWSFLYMAEE